MVRYGMPTTDPDNSQGTQETLRRAFGFDEFRPHQREIVEAILAGRDVFAAMPTGGGKSLCYQLPSLRLSGLSVVVSPLIALMQDQVDGALANGLDAAFLNSSLDPVAAREVWHRVASGGVRLLYVSPERLAMDAFRERLRETDVSLFAIDEAHCISEWGHEFRPDYRSLSILRTEFPGTPIAAFTATATPMVQDDVIRLLRLRSPLAIRGDFDRREIFYRVRRKERVNDQILAFVRSHPGQPGIVYRATRKASAETAAKLVSNGISAAVYHAGLTDRERRENQARFVRDEIRIIVATIAFGMGIDKSNVRWIIHGDLPRSIEAYYQETGRAGRDGDPAEAMLFYGPQDIMTIRYHIDRMESGTESERAMRNLQEMIRYADSGVCRRVQLLAHFAQEHAGDCGGCDVCEGEVAMSDQTIPAQMAMSAMVRTGERFGAHHIVDIVTGETSERVRRLGHDRLPTFGVGSEHDRRWWVRLVQDLEGAGLVRRRDGAKSGLVITNAGKTVLTGTERFRTADRPEQPAPRVKATESALDPQAQRLFERLRTLRTKLARERGVPPYVIFSDRTLRIMASARPHDGTTLLDVPGVGEHKARAYGADFLEEIRSSGS